MNPGVHQASGERAKWFRLALTVLSCQGETENGMVDNEKHWSEGQNEVASQLSKAPLVRLGIDKFLF